jgi:hypothetical protein
MLDDGEVRRVPFADFTTISIVDYRILLSR